MNDDMKEKYQQHYNQILNGTLSETIMKSISLQANVKLANEIIEEQNNKLDEYFKTIEELKKSLELSNNEKLNVSNSKIVSLEENNKKQQEVISNLNSEVVVLRKSKNEFESAKQQFESMKQDNINLNSEVVLLRKIKNEFENVKQQNNNLETFRSQLIKERETHQQITNQYENEIVELRQRIEILESPPKKKKMVKTPVVEQPPIESESLSILSELIMEENNTKDGGSF